jgi:hypothetical protein
MIRFLEYIENKWNCTIPTCQEGWDGYDIDSNMRGLWMKMLFIYKGEKSKSIGDIISKNVLSLS